MQGNGIFKRSFTAAVFGLITAKLSTAASVAPSSDDSSVRQRKPPNMVLIVTDQERAATPYEDANLRAFRNRHMQGYQELGCVEGFSTNTQCIEFKRHYTASTACTPSRANLFTGQYSSLHGITSTDGVGKGVQDTRPLPLDVPTMGDYFEAAGYETRYIGKWHLSEENISSEPTKPLNEERDMDAENEYMRRDKLGKYGFHGWVGPEPHGTAKVNSGTWRDTQFVDQALDWIRNRNANAESIEASEQKPFLLVLNFVNPHDICLWMLWKALFRMPVNDGTVPPIPNPPTLEEDLSTKPSPQAQWKEFGEFIFGRGDSEEFRQFYYYLHKMVDEQVATVIRALKAQSALWDNTIVVRTADHGEMLGSHGGLMQKWYAAYDELLRIPLVVSSPLFGAETDKRELDVPTSSVDLLPTMLALAGLDHQQIQKKLEFTHKEAHPLVGEDLSAIIKGGTAEPKPIYSTMSDDISRGTVQLYPGVVSEHRVAKFLRRIYHFELDALQGASSMEVVVSVINGITWKLVRTFDDPSLWSSPHENDTYRKRTGVFTTRGKVIVRTVPYQDEWELYNLSDDPVEAINLAHNDTLMAQGRDVIHRALAARSMLMEQLSQLRKEKLRHRTTPLPKFASQSLDEHKNDVFDLTAEMYGPLGPYFLGVVMLLGTIYNNEPLLWLLLTALVVVLLSLAYSIFHFLTSAPSKLRGLKVKAKVN